MRAFSLSEMAFCRAASETRRSSAVTTSLRAGSPGRRMAASQSPPRLPLPLPRPPPLPLPPPPPGDVACRSDRGPCIIVNAL